LLQENWGKLGMLLLIVHDFFRDANNFGALYDLHMLVNTWNGRAYSTTGTAAMLHTAGYGHTTTRSSCTVPQPGSASSRRGG